MGISPYNCHSSHYAIRFTLPDGNSWTMVKPNDQEAKDLIIGKREDWLNETHFKSVLAFAWA